VTDKPKDSEHPAEPERAITPFEPFDSRPKIAAAKSIDPLAGVARLFPRDARVPRNALEIERQRLERASRDTEPSDLLGEDDNTPAARPFEIRVEQRLSKLEKLAQKHDSQLKAVRRSSRRAAQHSLDTHTLVKDLSVQMRRFELENKWMPLLAWLVIAGIAVFALIRTYQ
jgi:hypothetical protein